MKKALVFSVFIVLAFFYSPTMAGAEEADIAISVFCRPNKASIGTELGRKIMVKVANVGTVETGGFHVDIVLSTDTTAPIAYAPYDPYFREDVLLLGGREYVSNLRPGQVKKVRLHGTNKIPLDTPKGVLYIGVIADPGKSVTEVTEDNNLDFHPIRIKIE